MRTGTTGITQVYGSGQQNYDCNTFFDESSTSVHSHIFNVENNFYRLQAFNLSGAETVTLEQVTNSGTPGQVIAPYAPVNGPVTLTINRTSYIIERPGNYRLTLSGGGLGVVKVVGFRYAMENEASQDIADALYAVLEITPCNFGQKIPRNQPQQNNVVGLDSNGCLVDFPITGLAPTPCSLGAQIPNDPTANNVVVSLDGSSCLVHQQFISSGVGNLIQLRPDGAYYGILPPRAGNYVSSSLGNDSNDGSELTPYATIARALQDFPEGTHGTIFLYRGDTFYIDPTNPTTSVITGLTNNQILAKRLNISDRSITFVPYLDPAIDAFNAYNLANGTAFSPYVNQQINFPVIQYQVYNPSDSLGTYQSVGFDIDINGSVSFNGCIQQVTQILVSNPSTIQPPINGSGTVNVLGGFITLSNFPYAGTFSNIATQIVTTRFCVIQDHVTPSTNPEFYQINTNVQLTSDIATIGGNQIAPSIPALAAYTFNPNNAPLYLADIALWKNNRVIDPARYMMFRASANFPVYAATNIQSGTTYTLVSADAEKGVLSTSNAATTITIPTNASQPIGVGTKVWLEEIYGGSVTITAAGGVTLNAPQGTVINSANQVFELTKTATDTWTARIYA